jgi:hypothetical protein
VPTAEQLVEYLAEYRGLAIQRHVLRTRLTEVERRFQESTDRLMGLLTLPPPPATAPHIPGLVPTSPALVLPTVDGA